jgi:hypothetical protein
MAQPLTVALPPELELWGGCTIRVTALDPTTGATMSGVLVENIVIDVDNIGGTDLTSGEFKPVLVRTQVPSG